MQRFILDRDLHILFLMVESSQISLGIKQAFRFIVAVPCETGNVE